jgi:hypothetical protein
MSLPMSPDHSSSCALVAGRPVSSLAANRVVAALPLPPPRPAPEVRFNQPHTSRDRLKGGWTEAWLQSQAIEVLVFEQLVTRLNEEKPVTTCSESAQLL